VSDHPVCGAKVGCAEIFLMPQPPLLTRPHEEGSTLAHLAAASPRRVSVSLWFLTAIDGVPQGFEASTRGFPIQNLRRYGQNDAATDIE
jgi:hypothetical protein